MSIVRSVDSSTDAPSGGRTSTPSSSIHTAIGTFQKPSSSSSKWRESIRRRMRRCRGVDERVTRTSGSTSSATVTTSSFGKSSARSACHPGRLVRHPHQLAHATSSTFWPRSDDSANGLPVAVGQRDVGNDGRRRARDRRSRARAPTGRAPRRARAACASRSASISTESRPSDGVPPGSGTHTSPLQSPSGLASQPVRAAKSSAATERESTSMRRRYPPVG